MPSTDADSPDDGFFNDLSQHIPDSNEHQDLDARRDSQEGQKDDAVSKAKRIACILCRKRKLRCDGSRPSCGTCQRLKHDCAYDEVRKKSGPKRGYVKLLEARLQQVETLLKTQESSDATRETPLQDSTSAYVATTLQQSLANGVDRTTQNMPDGTAPNPEGNQTSMPARASNTDGEFPWEMIGLGLEEPLPPQDVMDELYQIYFAKIHPSLPIIHKPRFFAAMNLAPNMRPPVCLRYIMWSLAASVVDKYDALQEHFYRRARKYAQLDELRGHGESTITLAHCQAWILVGTYEFKMMYFPRAWLSAGRAVRLAHMMQLHRLDGAGLDVKQCLAPPKDWTEREERRRTFWMAFALDRYASIGTGWPMMMHEEDIMTNMPASEDAFDKSKPMPTGSLEQALSPGGALNLQPFGGIVATAALFGRNLLHLHRPGPDERDQDLDGGFWTRHRELENVILTTSLGLPDHLRLPLALPDANVVFVNMCIHTSAICLHQAAIYKADRYKLPISISNESKIRCVTAAAEIASIMRMISHVDLSGMNPFISFCVYVAARVFVQYLKTRPKDQQMNSSLQFLLQAMGALRRKNPLTESFLVQLDLDLESAGLAPMPKTGLNPSGTAGSVPATADTLSCTPLYEIRESQSATAPVNTFGNAPGARLPANRRFEVVNSQVGLDLQSPQGFVTQGRATTLPSRDGVSNSDRFSSTVVPLQDDNDMDVSTDPSVDATTPASSNSRSKAGGASHTSYSPAGQNDPQSQQQFLSPGAFTNQVPLPHTSGGDMNSNFFSTGDDMYGAVFGDGASTTFGDGTSNAFMMGNEWDPAALNASMTPMSEGTWNQMVEGMSMGWDGLGPPHGEIPFVTK